MPEKCILLDMTPGELGAYFKELGQPAFRAGQVYSWLTRGVPFSEMSNLPKALREQLMETCDDLPMELYGVFPSQKDDTVKFLFRCRDDNLIEGVLMHYHYGYSLCISTQVGCKMGCRFCASTIAGFKRDLTSSEILGQIYASERDSGRKISGVVLMGIGEPMDNFDNVVNFLEVLSCPKGFNMSLRHVSVSTCGIVPRIYELAEKKLGITLSISLHASNNKSRSEIMPVNDRYDINELLAACRYYFKVTGRRISFEYALIDGHNDSMEDARELAELLGGFVCHVNIIPVNKIKERNYHSDRKSANRFRGYLEKLGINATVRRTLGADIDAACGQLRREYEI